MVCNIEEPSLFYPAEKCQQEHEHLGEAIDADSDIHVSGGEGTVVLANEGLVKEFAEVVVRAAEAAVEDTGQGGFGVATVGAGMASAVSPDEL